MTVPPETLARFLKGLPALDDDIVGVAVSGGPDSLALLLLAEAAWPGRVRAATVDHGLRPESAAEARWVADLCAARGVPHSTLTPETPITGSLQAEARRARYALLDAWRLEQGVAWVMTAHHADDQAETLLMRLNRGAGVGGLAGIRAVNRHILRPLLGWRRAELQAIVEAEELAALRDPSNEDMRFDRARFRRHLADAPWIDPQALARSAAHLADAEAALGWMADEIAAERIVETETGIALDPAGLPAELVRRLLRIALKRREPGLEPSGPELDRALAEIARGGQISLGGLLVRGGKLWQISTAPPRRTAI
ncbi:tRNA lysidine(34) synthetase TilS [Sphingomonas cavernae]|uniref:tRNA(Ile)-lysidine synthase n=1 Tax=Sphingomonas cavernae TaxID=2320861 RepID=A0A418WRQ0_9SPHN|nr:tRNA lysidine(34) synthetase TilS [Sphingomonas cavernae]RJF93932.1 tRNA lysidine(34) synthetase TilS [Sphingomonas cavernae]